MSLRRIKHTFLRLTAEEKVAGTGALLVLIGIFLPWYSVFISFDKKSISENGLSGDIGVIGFVILLMIILALLVLIGEHLNIKIPKLGYTREQMLFFLMGQSAFLVLLTIAVYTKRSLEFTDAELRFGIYFALVGAFLGAFAIFSQIQKLKKKEVQDFFGHEDSAEKNLKANIDKEEYAEELNEEEPEEDRMLFEEKTTHVTEEVYDEPEEEIIEEYEEEPEEEIIEKHEEEPEKEIIEEYKESTEELESENQGNYFMREAGFEESNSDDKNTESEKEDETDESKEKKEDKGLSMGFYED